MGEWKKISLGEIISTNNATFSKKDKWGFVNYLDTGNITENVINNIQCIDLTTEKLPSRARRKVDYDNIIYSMVRPNQKHFGIVKNLVDNFLVSTGFVVIDVNKEKANPDFIYYFLSQQRIVDELQIIAEQSVSTYPSIKPSDIEKLEINLPPLEEQKRIAAILSALDDKIEINRRINENLEQQLKTLFVKMFGTQIDSITDGNTTLDELVIIIDNRGKTPPLSLTTTNYPIIDVRSLSGNSRFIDYNNCSKFVTKDIYDNWFRNGHPKPYDILISTVGSLAEMKIFMGGIGCIAQNVVGFRCKSISPLYLYQYLNYIKHDLVSYNIGSVQPSIKVSHIIKQSIYVAPDEIIEAFDNVAYKITEQIYANCCESKLLKQMRDILLPKLMSGEIDLSNILV